MDWLGSLEKSLSLHEVVGHGGPFYNGVIKEPEVPTFEYHVEAEFFAHVLQFMYSPIQGFDLACMFSHMANPISFSNQYGEAYLQISSELLVSISKSRDLSGKFSKLSESSNKVTISDLIKHFNDFENLNYNERIQLCLLPPVSFLAETSRDDRKSFLFAIYKRNTQKPVPEPIIATAHPKQQ